MRLVRRRLRTDELTHGVVNVTKLRTGVVPDHVPETAAVGSRFRQQHFFDGNGSVCFADEPARADGAIRSVRQPERAGDAGQVFRGIDPQRAVGGPRGVRERLRIVLGFRVTQQLIERCDIGTRWIHESSGRFASQTLSRERPAERQCDRESIFEVTHARYLAEIGIAESFAYEAETPPIAKPQKKAAAATFARDHRHDL